MTTQPRHSLQARKKPVQKRSAATVEAIYEATIQVLLRFGAERLTTIRVAERAGVSVGTLYQYYPNKESLLFAVLERHLMQVAAAIERACEASANQPLRTMVEAVVAAFLHAKLQQRDTSVALYRIASNLDGELLIAGLFKRSQRAIVAMLRSAPSHSRVQLDFSAFMFLCAMSGATRAVLEAGAPPAMLRKLHEHLEILGEAYLRRTVLGAA